MQVIFKFNSHPARWKRRLRCFKIRFRINLSVVFRLYFRKYAHRCKYLFFWLIRKYAFQAIQQKGLRNLIFSVRYSGNTNIGHKLPFFQRLFGKIGPVKQAQLNCFAYVLRFYYFASGKVRYRSCHFQYPVISSCRKTDVFIRLRKHFRGFGIRCAVFSYLSRCHFCVAVNPFAVP